MGGRGCRWQRDLRILLRQQGDDSLRDLVLVARLRFFQLALEIGVFVDLSVEQDCHFV